MIKDTNKETLNCPIEHLEEEEKKVKHQSSINTVLKQWQTITMITPYLRNNSYANQPECRQMMMTAQG